jgi:hypothetical protein
MMVWRSYVSPTGVLGYIIGNELSAWYLTVVSRIIPWERSTPCKGFDH